MNSRQIILLVWVNFRDFFREPGAIFWSFAFPVGMAWVLGIAFSSTPEKKYRVLLTDEKVWQALFPNEKNKNCTLGYGTGTKVNASFEITSAKTIDQLLQSGAAILYIDLHNGKPVYHYDAANSEAVSLYLLIEREVARRSGTYNVASTEQITTKGTRYIDFLLPGLLAMGIMNSCVWGMSWYLIELRMKKLLRRIVATPLKKSTFIFSHFITRFLLCVFESCVLLLFAWLFFGTSVTGDRLGFILLYLSAVLCFGGIGLILGSRTQSTHVGNGLINAVVLPMSIVSGVFFSYQGFPEWIIPLIKLLPLTILADGMRAIFNEAATLPAVLLPSLILSTTGILLYAFGLRIFKWY